MITFSVLLVISLTPFVTVPVDAGALCDFHG
jgi:hypothetical protein